MMKTLFIHATINEEVVIPKDVIDKLPARLGLFTTIQFAKQLPQIKRQLIAAGKTPVMVGQTLGCRAEAAEAVASQVDAFLYVGSGEFHPLQVSYKADKPVYLWQPLENKLGIIAEKEVAAHKKRLLGNMSKFYHAKTVGILITTKVGQNDNKINVYSQEIKMRAAKELMARNDGKEYYIFAFDTLDLQSLEDFPFIDVWVNTACSRIVDEKLGLVNMDDIRAHEEMVAVAKQPLTILKSYGQK